MSKISAVTSRLITKKILPGAIKNNPEMQNRFIGLAKNIFDRQHLRTMKGKPSMLLGERQNDIMNAYHKGMDGGGYIASNVQQSVTL